MILNFFFFRIGCHFLSWAIWNNQNSQTRFQINTFLFFKLHRQIYQPWQWYVLSVLLLTSIPAESKGDALKSKHSSLSIGICFSEKFFSHILCFFLSVNDTKGKKKVLGSNQKLKFNPTELILYCKDLRIIRYCFDEAGPESAKKVSDTQFSPFVLYRY